MTNVTPTPKPYRAPAARSVKKHAQDILSRPGVRMGYVLSTILLLTTWIGSIYLVENTWYALDWIALYEASPLAYNLLDALVYVLDAIVIVFLGLPLLYGWLRYVSLASTGTTPSLSLLFTPFGQKHDYMRSLAVTLCLAAHLVLLLLPCALFGALCFFCAVWGGVIGWLLAVLLGILALAALIGATLGNAGMLLVVFLDINHPALTVRELLALAHRYRKGKRFELWLLGLSLIPQFLLGLLTIGTLLLFHAIPLALISFQRAYGGITGERLPVTDVVSTTTQPESNFNQ